MAETRSNRRDINRARIVDDNFQAFLKTYTSVENGAVETINKSGLSAGEWLEVLNSQMASRQMDLAARIMRLENKVFYTIGSSGHEANAWLGFLTRHTDPAFLHYRSGGFMAERSRKLKESDFIRDTALSFAASAEDPASGGRHKVWGSKPLWVIPQTSTIASHLPKAMGTAMAISHANRQGKPLPVPSDSIVFCNFGDASLNHSTSQGAINAVQWAVHQGHNMPLLMMCEDNHWGISVRTPDGWVVKSMQHREGIRYFYADSKQPGECLSVCKEAVNYVRTRRKPAFLHMKTVRLMGHAGTDFELDYRELEELELAEASDPMLDMARLVLNAGLIRPEALLKQYIDLGEACVEAIRQADQRPRLTTFEQISAPQAPLHVEQVMEQVRKQSASLQPGQQKLNLAQGINRGLAEILAFYPESMLFGEDVGRKGGVYTVTKGLQKQFGRARVFNTLLDEQSILGLAQGYANMGSLPIPEIQYLAYYHNACDQVRGEACSLQYFSNGQYRNPMLMRIASLGYQKGFGGHFHNDNSFAALRDIPGLVIACPSRSDDAIALLRTLIAMMKTDGRVCAFLEPIALYMRRDLYAEGDGLWMFEAPAAELEVAPGEARLYPGEQKGALVITYGNGVPMSLQAIEEAASKGGPRATVMDLRWLLPLNESAILSQARNFENIVVVDEGRRSGGISEAIMALLMENMPGKSVKRVTGKDCYTPLGAAAPLVLPSVADIRQAL